jgi:hypothetical protein
MEELAKHIFIGGNVNKLASSDGTHLASAFLPIFPSETLTNIDEKTLIAKPAKSVRDCSAAGVATHMLS